MRLLIAASLLCFSTSSVMSQATSEQRFDLLSTYARASHLFLGSIMWVENATDLTVETEGYRLSAQSSKGLQLESVSVHAQRYVVTVEELYKGNYPDHVELVTPVVEGHEWIVDDFVPEQTRYFDTAVFGGNLSGQLEERGLFVVQERATDGLHVLLRVETLGQVGTGLDALRLYGRGDAQSLEQAIHILLEMDHRKLEAEAESIRELREELNTILMSKDLASRRNQLMAYIKRLGYDDLWSYDEYLLKRRKLERQATHSTQTLPALPQDPIERLWHDASQEVESLNILMKSRSTEAK